MTRFCIAAGLVLTTHCAARPSLIATDRPRCVRADPGRIKPPRPIRAHSPEARR